MLIELKLKTQAQLYNSLDPAPFHERDLDADAADYIREAMQELHAHAKVKLVIHLQEAAAPDTVRDVSDAIHHYFEYRARTRQMELKQLLRIGRISLVVGLAFMAFCFELSQLLAGSDNTFASISREGLIIIGWVAMWRPIDIFLYSWWPIRGEIRLYQRIARLDIEVKGL